MKKVFINPRNHYMDVVKFIAIFLVVWGHVIQGTTEFASYPIQQDAVVCLIYTTHMPLFMGVCGYFFGLSVNKYSLREYINLKLKNRLLGLAVPMLSFGVLKYLIKSCQGINSNVFSEIKGVWFLGDLFLNTIVFIFLIKFFNKNFLHDIFIAILGALLVLFPVIGYGAHGLYMYIFFFIGFVISNINEDKYKNYIVYWKIVLVLFVFLFVFFREMPWPAQDFTLDLKKNSIISIFVIDLLKIVLGFLGGYLVLVFVWKLYCIFRNNIIVRSAVLYGRYTLDIYLIQIIVVERIFNAIFKKYFIELYGGYYLSEWGYICEVFLTGIISILLFKIILLLVECINNNKTLTRVLFYRVDK